MLNIKFLNFYLLTSLLCLPIFANNFSKSEIAIEHISLSEITKEIKNIIQIQNRNTKIRKASYLITAAITVCITKLLLDHYYSSKNSNNVIPASDLESIRKQLGELEERVNQSEHLQWLQKKEINKLRNDFEKNDDCLMSLIDLYLQDKNSNQTKTNFISRFYNKIGRLTKALKSAPGQTLGYIKTNVFSYVPFNKSISYVSGKVVDGVKATPFIVFSLGTSIAGHALFVLGPNLLIDKLIKGYGVYFKQLDFENYSQRHTNFYQALELVNDCLILDPERAQDELYVALSKENITLAYNQLIKEGQKIIAFMIYTKIRNKNIPEITRKTLDNLTENFKNNLSDISNFIESHNLLAIRNRIAAINNTSKMFINFEAVLAS